MLLAIDLIYKPRSFDHRFLSSNPALVYKPSHSSLQTRAMVYKPNHGL